jgi:hypothetical protein
MFVIQLLLQVASPAIATNQRRITIKNFDNAPDFENCAPRYLFGVAYLGGARRWLHVYRLIEGLLSSTSFDVLGIRKSP